MTEPRYTYNYVPGDDDGFDHLMDSEQWEFQPEDFDVVRDWCRAEFGQGGPDARWICNARGCSFWLRTDADVIAFRLRWC